MDGWWEDGWKLEEQGLNTQHGGMQRSIQNSPLVLMLFSWALREEEEKVPVKVCAYVSMEQVKAWIVSSRNKPKTWGENI